MKRIERKFEVVTETKRRFIISQFPADKIISCAECNQAMLTIEQTARFLNIKQRRIFQLAELGVIHFTETESGALTICLNSLTNFLFENERK